MAPRRVIRMPKRAIAASVVAIAAGSGLVYATFAATRGTPGTAAPPPVLDTLSSPAFLVPSIIIAACVAVVVIVMIRRAARARLPSTNDQPTGFRVGKKTIGGTRVSTPTGDASGEDVKDKSTSYQVTGFRVGKKTQTGT